LGSKSKTPDLRLRRPDPAAAACGKQEVALAEKSPVIVKRYAKERLYDMAACSLTIAELRKWAARAVPFVVLQKDVNRGAFSGQQFLRSQ
jgi:hypothetical protein